MAIINLNKIKRMSNKELFTALESARLSWIATRGKLNATDSVMGDFYMAFLDSIIDELWDRGYWKWKDDPATQWKVTAV